MNFMEAAKEWTEKFISVVEAYPCIYDGRCKDYADKNKKERAWEEVSCQIIDNWVDLNSEERCSKVKDLKQKWSNLRICFRRELSAQKQVRSGQACAKRSKYLHFDQMLFLIPTLKDRDSMVDSSMLCSNSPTDGDDAECEYSYEYESPTPSWQSRSKKRSVSYDEESIPEVSVNKTRDDFYEDDDKAFLMSLLPYFRALNRDEKLDLRIETLKLVKRFPAAASNSNPSDHNSFTSHSPQDRQTSYQRGYEYNSQGLPPTSHNQLGANNPVPSTNAFFRLNVDTDEDHKHV